MTSKTELQAKIDNIEKKLEETKESANWGSGPVQDALKIVIPMMEDYLIILKELFGYIYGPKEEGKNG